MASKTDIRNVPDTYLDLVREFPLVRIRDDDHLDEANQVIQSLLERNLDDGARDYLDVLTDLVEDYEEATITVPDAEPADVLRELMRVNDLTQLALSRKAAIKQSTISEVLSGKRTLTAEHIVKLSRLFGVGPAAFLKV
jgi:HTH-type transcriptional regulator/antitoxin HigA